MALSCKSHQSTRTWLISNSSNRYEVACEPNNLCNVDQLSFKAYLSRWMAATTKVAPWTSDQILPLLASSATAAAQSCSGGDDGATCGTKWTQTGWDGTYGVGQQMSALEVIQSNLIQKVSGPVGNKTGGISKGNPSAGSGSSSHVDNAPGIVGTKDKAGAGVLTAVVIVMLLGGGYVSSDPLYHFGILTDGACSGCLSTKLVYGEIALGFLGRVSYWVILCCEGNRTRVTI